MKRIFMVLSLVFLSFVLVGCTDTSDLERRIVELEEIDNGIPSETPDNEAPIFSGIFSYTFDMYYNELYNYTSNPELLKYTGIFYDNVFFYVANGLIEENIIAIDNIDGDISDNIIMIIPTSLSDYTLELNNPIEVNLFVTDSSGNISTLTVLFTFIYESSDE